jgi:MYXO-CTERM domain-containing protein
MEWKHAILRITLICALGTPAFGAAIIYASGSGGCGQNGSGCGVPWTQDSPTAGNLWRGDGGFFRSWFAFDIPAGGTITAATLWASASPYDWVEDLTRTYTLYEPSSIDYDGLADGPALGSTGVQDVARYGGSLYYDIPLNGTGLDLLNASQGTRVFLGGGVDVYDPNVIVSLFNMGIGYCNAGGTICVGPSYLELEVASTSATPEPGAWMLMLGGICLLPAIRRRHHRPNGSRT